MDFTAQHYQQKPLVIANVWDVPSAQAAQRAGYQAIGTSSAAVAAMLGYPDGEALPFDALLLIVRRIRAVCSLPLSVDVEAGYATTAEDMTLHLRQLAEMGVVGINLEDSRVIDGVRKLEDPDLFSQRLQAVRTALVFHRCSLFINVRSDAFLLGLTDALDVTLSRITRYAACGADGLFIPCVIEAQDIAALVQHTRLPLNVMAIPGLSDFTTLAKLGVRRISMGNALHSAIQHRLNDLLLTVQQQQSFAGVFNDENYR
ncbi:MULTISPECIES: isocitrate lyase/PEP mutase family protein [Enterobacteriaceae]|uniref:isocitrate lyase/PEP mutase family protein n=1 Tax=Enterobacteriaceae TaxID=543 RepID=UPI0015DC9136|nr:MULTISPECIES: isocitrate lyase/phosphoenolpyruvate mutase family protein [unclassified Klebsiella]HAT3952823.1 isocitrate lyase/phosphoenolpyruvate mutase family protein [Kluyvera ascorbata]BBR58785.1 carboxyvinyl-carboxyphosphonate phosphorylmutase [Klebsiella sp. WP4-W18-ESBL-05]BBS91921.1 carboxyvinyl-carboxyphosphonate phosphorylmutase [Klebsiella sp. WP7-S18-CRE-02]BBS96943.1 carboxyvinyl-carboxyphosphonate phosphorylmutase [Klebsiella sp. WP7-S18-CRE-03]BBT01977.1 carboxyvinyl-carboxy